MKFKGFFNLFNSKSKKNINSIASFFNEEEISVLKKMNGVKANSLTDDKKELFSRFIDSNVMVKASNYEKLDYFTVATLQNILAEASLSKSGKKSELVDRIKSNFSEKDLSSNSALLPEIYIISPLGKEVLAVKNG